MPTFIEVFAGCGGLSSGLEKAGFVPLMLVDNDKNCVETLEANHTRTHAGGLEIKCMSVKDLHLNEYRNRVDILAGGVPCQAFSQAGLRKGLDDIRGSLFYDFIRLVDECEPKVFLIENVVGLTTHNQGETLQMLLEQLKHTQTNAVEYTIQYQVLNAHDYGVAQKRKRVIIVGVRSDAGMPEFAFPEPLVRKPTLRDALENCPPSEGVVYPQRKMDVMRHVPPGGCWIDLPDDMKREYMGRSLQSGGGKRGIARRISWDEPCLTLTTSPCQKQTERCHPEETRPFTVREYARIQSFPDSYIFKGSMMSKYRQIGNAVPVELAYHIGKSIMGVLLLT